MGFHLGNLNYVISSDPSSSRSQHEEVTAEAVSELEPLPTLPAEYSLSSVSRRMV